MQNSSCLDNFWFRLARRGRARFERPWLLGLAAVIGFAAGYEPARLLAQATTADSPAASTADPLAVPQGSVDDLTKFIEQVTAMRPEARGRDAVIEFVKKTRGALVAAADQILAAQPQGPAAELAVATKIEALALLSRVGEKTATEQLQAFAAALRQGPHAALAAQADLALLAAQVPELANVEGEARATLYSQIKEQLLAAPRDAEHFGVAYQTINMLDRLGDDQLAVQAYQEFAQFYGSSDDARVSGMAKQFSGAARRMQLVGHPFASFSGATVAGETFDLASLKDKVVLVDFWATWCGPCVAELPNVQRNYEAYHERGFEVVGVSLDDDRGALDKFLVENKIPWPTLLSDQAQTAEGGGSLSDYYGVTSIPTVILIGRDGKVISVSARGEELSRLLAEALGPPPG